MADYVRTEVTTKRVRYELHSPTNATELSKAMTAAATSFLEMRARPVTYDDDVTATVEDDLIVISFEVPS